MLAAMRLASSRVSRFAEWCDAAICPELGDKRKCAACVRSDVKTQSGHQGCTPEVRGAALSRSELFRGLPDLFLLSGAVLAGFRNHWSDLKIAGAGFADGDYSQYRVDKRMGITGARG